MNIFSPTEALLTLSFSVISCDGSRSVILSDKLDAGPRHRSTVVAGTVQSVLLSPHVQFSILFQLLHMISSRLSPETRFYINFPMLGPFTSSKQHVNMPITCCSSCSLSEHYLAQSFGHTIESKSLVYSHITLPLKGCYEHCHNRFTNITLNVAQTQYRCTTTKCSASCFINIVYG
uniref:Uncharacterized protein n=1 Tax=Phytophthora infestans TaxID=4787 RepID=Q572J5_PHYIN|nr:hypothetical protein PI35.0300 [Phytophthora infestans]